MGLVDCGGNGIRGVYRGVCCGEGSMCLGIEEKCMLISREGECADIEM